jgi:hypothetical protein
MIVVLLLDDCCFMLKCCYEVLWLVVEFVVTKELAMGFVGF